MKIITNKAVLRLDIYILATKYLKIEAFGFIKVIGYDEKTNKGAKIVFNLKKEIKIKKTLYKKKKDA